MQRPMTVLVGIIIVIAAFGAAHSYACNRATQTLDQTIQETTIHHIGMINRLQNPNREIYRVTLKIENPTANKVKISLTDLQVSIDEYSFTLRPLADTWKGTINPREPTQVEGAFTIYSNTLSELQSRETVTFQLNGTIQASTNQLWVEQTREQHLNETIKMIFD